MTDGIDEILSRLKDIKTDPALLEAGFKEKNEHYESLTRELIEVKEEIEQVISEEIERSGALKKIHEKNIDLKISIGEMLHHELEIVPWVINNFSKDGTILSIKDNPLLRLTEIEINFSMDTKFRKDYNIMCNMLLTKKLYAISYIVDDALIEDLTDFDPKSDEFLIYLKNSVKDTKYKINYSWAGKTTDQRILIPDEENIKKVLRTNKRAYKGKNAYSFKIPSPILPDFNLFLLSYVAADMIDKEITQKNRELSKDLNIPECENLTWIPFQNFSKKMPTIYTGRCVNCVRWKYNTNLKREYCPAFERLEEFKKTFN